MPFISQHELNQRDDEIARLREVADRWTQMAPYLHLAEGLQQRLVAELGSGALRSVDDIANAALTQTYDAQRQQAIDDLTAQYEQEHRKALYEQVLTRVQKEEGESIFETVSRTIDTDPELALKLRNSARRELTARANITINDAITKEQQEVIDEETDRQIEIDRWDVKFALEGKLDLGSKELKKVLQPRDRLVVAFKKKKFDQMNAKSQTGLIFTWNEDVHGVCGWLFTEAINPASPNEYYFKHAIDADKIPSDRFLTIGCQMADLVKGKKVACPDIITMDMPLVVNWTDDSGKPKSIVLNEYTQQRRDYSVQKSAFPSSIASTDFQTRDIQIA